MSVSFKEAATRLLTLRRASFSHAREALSTIQILIIGRLQGCKIDPLWLHQLRIASSNPDAFAGDKTEFLVSTAICIEHLFPVYEDMMAEQIAMGQGLDELFIPLMPMGWWDGDDDDFAGHVHEPSRFEQRHSLGVFLWALFESSAGKWNELTEVFDWPVPVPKFLHHYYTVDGNKLGRLLHEQGLGLFISAINYVHYNTGNLFLDMSYYNNFDTVGISAETIVGLTKEWRDARAIIDAYEEARELVEEDPAILASLLEIFTQCVQVDKTKDPDYHYAA